MVVTFFYFHFHFIFEGHDVIWRNAKPSRQKIKNQDDKSTLLIELCREGCAFTR